MILEPITGSRIFLGPGTPEFILRFTPRKVHEPFWIFRGLVPFLPVGDLASDAELRSLLDDWEN